MSLTDTSPPPAGERPNVLLVTLDQFRADCAPGAPGRLVRTPMLDRLAAGGAAFTDHWAQTAPCGPSRASMLTGRYLHNHRVVSNGTPLDDRFDNLARLARRAGYDPVLFGYTDTALDPRTIADPDDPRLRDWEEVLPGFTVGVRLPEHLEAWGAWLRQRGYDPGGDVPAAMYRRRPVDVPTGRGSLWPPAVYDAEHSESAFVADSVIEHLRGRTEPWFVHASFLRPHPPYLVPAPYHDLYDPADVPAPRRLADPAAQGAVHPLVALALAFDEVRAPADDLEVRQLRATYYGMITEVDAQLGRVLDHLDASGQARRTVVVVTSDHGEQLGDQWLVEKLGFFDASYHIPLIVRWPGRATPGTVVDLPTENVDIVPTLAEAMGQPVPFGVDGRSLVPLLDGSPPDGWRTESHWEWDFRRPDSELIDDEGLAHADRNLCVLRDAHRKYVHFADGSHLLFDLDEDPDETIDRSTDPSRRDEVLHLAQRMLSWRMSSDEEILARYRISKQGLRWR